MSQKAIDIATRLYMQFQQEIADNQIVIEEGLADEVVGHFNALVSAPIEGYEKIHGDKMGAVFAEDLAGAGQ